MHNGPEWVNRISKVLESGRNGLIVHFNIEDELVHEGEILSVKEVVTRALKKSGIVYYSLAGFDFSDDQTELLFRDINGLMVPLTDPGPIEDYMNEAQAAAHFEKEQDYNEWCKMVEEGAKYGLTPVQCLPKIPANDLDKSVAWIDNFVRLRIPEASEVTMFDGSPMPHDTLDCAVIVDYASMLLPDGNSQSPRDQKVFEIFTTKWAEMGANGCPIVLLTPSLVDVSKSLYGRGSHMATIEVPYPDYDAMYRYLKELKKTVNFKLNGSSIEEVARLAGGLSCRHLKALVLESNALGEPLDAKKVRRYKQEVLTDELAGLVEVVVPNHGFETVGGLEHVIMELTRISDYIVNDKENLVPMGVLLLGPPGTGKTYIAEAFAKKVGFNFIKFGNIKSKWVGESERNIAKVFQIAKALAPVVVFVDEIDQEGSRNSEGDSGVSAHIFASILRFMSDTSLRGKVVWIAATNRPDLMDPAMKRPGRFDIRLPLLYPDATERAAIFQVMFLKYDLVPSKDVAYKALAELTDDFSGADIEAIVIEAARLADTDGYGSTVGHTHLVEAVSDYIIHYDRTAIKEMEKIALAECNSIRLLPPKYREQVRANKNGKDAADAQGSGFKFKEV